jgi:hypothetical protein
MQGKFGTGPKVPGGGPLRIDRSISWLRCLQNPSKLKGYPCQRA